MPSVKKSDKNSRILLIILAFFLVFILLAQHFSLPFDLYYDFHERELRVETWQRYKPYNLKVMSQEQKEKYAYDYMLDKYGVEVDVKSVGIPGGTTDFSRFYTMAVFTPKYSDDPFEFYHLYFKGNGKVCDDYYLHDVQDAVAEKVRQDAGDLPYDCVINVHVYTLSPCFPTYKMKRLAKKDPLEFIKLKETSTRIDYFFSSEYAEHKDELRDTLQQKTTYMYSRGNLFFVDGDIHEIDLSQLDPSTLLAFYSNR